MGEEQKEGRRTDDAFEHSTQSAPRPIHWDREEKRDD